MEISHQRGTLALPTVHQQTSSISARGCVSGTGLLDSMAECSSSHGMDSLLLISVQSWVLDRKELNMCISTVYKALLYYSFSQVLGISYHLIRSNLEWACSYGAGLACRVLR
ncbi:TPA: hypothetical protein ACH3X1_000104 [Trebouxia sp. C0004]